jgi:DNA replication and repair protein RecF
MYVRALGVTDFRSWSGAELAFGPGPSVLIGANGQGKTNLVEALGYVATLSSHRVATDAPLIRAGAERAVIRCAVVSDDRELRVELEITAGRSNRARLNGSPMPRPRDLLGALRVVQFAPEDLAIVRGDPAERRRFLDDLVVARAPRMAAVRSDLDRILRQRAALLKSAGPARRAAGALPTLDVWDQQLAAAGAALTVARLSALRALRPHAVGAYAAVAPSGGDLTVRYASGLAAALPELGSGSVDPDEPAVEAALLSELARVRTQELERGVNLVGPHRDDLDLQLHGLPLRGYASHGEGWSAALALRLATFELLRDEHPSGSDPVLILDDVFAELDSVRRDHLALVAGKAEQALVTAAVPADVPEQLQGAQYEIAAGQARRVR